MNAAKERRAHIEWEGTNSTFAFFATTSLSSWLGCFSLVERKQKTKCGEIKSFNHFYF